MSSDNNKRIAKNTMMLYIRLFLIMGVSLYTSRIVLRTLGVVDYGILNVVGGVISMMSFFITSLAIITERYVSVELGKENEGNVTRIFSTALLIHFLMGLVIVILAETVGLWFLTNKIVVPIDRYNAAFWVYQLSVLNCFIAIFTAPYMGSIIAHERMTLFAYISTIEAVLKLLVTISLSYILFDKLVTYSTLNLVLAILMLITYVLYNIRNFPNIKFQFHWNSNLFKEMLGMTGWNLVDNFSNILYTQGVNIVLNIFFGPAVNAARGIATQIQTGINGFSGNLQTAFNPQIAKSYSKNEIEEFVNLIINSCRFSLMILLILLMPICIEAGTVLNIWLGIVPDHTINFVRVILLITIIESISRPITMGALATGRIRKYELYSNFLIILILPIVYIILTFIKIPELAFIVTLLILLITLFIRLLLLKEIVNFSILLYWRNVILQSIRYIIPSLIMALLPYFLMPQTISRCMLVFIVSVSSTLVCIYYFGLMEPEKLFLKNRIHSLLKIKK